MESTGVAIAQFLFVGLAQFAFIGLRSFQQRNVAFGPYFWIVPTSCLMALCEVYVIANIAQAGFGLLMVLTLGLSGGLGSLCATFLHRFLFREAT